MVALTIFAAGWFFWSAVPSVGDAFARKPSGYYGLQTAGFSSGHSHVALKPAPGLLALTDPYDPVENAPYRAHDMTLWQGKYFLYYGVSPVLVFFWPTVALTGWYPTEAFAVAMFCSIGVALALGVLLAVRRRYFPGAPSWVLACGALVLAGANPVATLTQLPQFYQVPIACAFAMHMGMLGAIFGALRPGNRSAWIWLAVASAAFGLSIGARPNYLFSGFALAAAWAALVWRQPAACRLSAGMRLGAAAFGPALAAGVALLAYNWLRFGSATEFGMKYTLGGERIPDIKLMGLEYLFPRLADYLFTAGNWGRYFPFFSAPAGAPYGVLLYAPWLWLIPAALAGGAGGRPGIHAALTRCVAAAAGANLALLCLFFGLTDRYPADFVPAALLLGGIGALALSEKWRKSWWSAPAFGVLAGATVFCALAVWVKRLPNPTGWLAIARVANTPTSWWERMRGTVPGGLRLQLELPAGREGLSEPIVHTGLSASGRNWLQLDYLPGGRVRPSYFHAGLGLIHGREIAIPADRKITLEMESGALLPPAAHPMFATWTPEERLVASRTLKVRVDGKDVLEAANGCYESTPGDLVVGRMRWSGSGVESAFSGRVLAVETVPARRPVLLGKWTGESGPVELKVRLPTDRAAGRDPLMTTGGGKEFDILYCEYAGPGRVSFGLYHAGSEPVVSPIMEFDPLVPHTLQVWLGSLAEPGQPGSAEESVPAARRLTVIFDGKVALNREQKFYPARRESVVFGANTLAREVVGANFGGRIESLKPVAWAALPDPGAVWQYGAVDMTVVFARGAQGAAEPLVVTGSEGAGNFIYLRYLAGDKMVFGFDHWGIGGIVGQAVPIDVWKPQRLRITMGSLYPPDENVGVWRTRVEVKLGDVVVLEGEHVCHPSTRRQVRIGQNVIGGSTCGPQFSGQIQRLERTARPAP